MSEKQCCSVNQEIIARDETQVRAVGNKFTIDWPTVLSDPNGPVFNFRSHTHTHNIVIGFWIFSSRGSFCLFSPLSTQLLISSGLNNVFFTNTSLCISVMNSNQLIAIKWRLTTSGDYPPHLSPHVPPRVCHSHLRPPLPRLIAKFDPGNRCLCLQCC